MEPWFDIQTSNTLGGVLGAVIGIWAGCVLGAMSSLYINNGWKKLAYSLWGITFTAGLVILCIGLFALCIRQPRYVWYPFLLCGGITALVIGSVFPVVRKRFIERERRIMEIKDL